MEQSIDLTAAVEAAEHYTTATSVSCVVMDPEGTLLHGQSAHAYPCTLCRRLHSHGLGSDQAPASHVASIDHARRFGGQYVFMCESSFTHWTAPITDGSRTVGALVAGPVLTIDDTGFFEKDLLGTLEATLDDAERAELRSLFERIPRITPERVTSLAQLLTMVAGQLSSPGANPFADAQAQLRRESRINEYIQTLKERRRSQGADPELPSYPIEKESDLLRAIRERNTERAQAVLNQLLGHVFFAYGGDVEALRHRSRELIVLLSRITISKGAEPERVFGLNYQFLDGLESRSDVNEIAHWMSRIVRRFAEFVFTVPPGTAHFGPLRRVVTYVHAHYRRRLTLGELARVADLSSSYLSRLFHDEMGEPLSHFIRRVRVDKAQELLVGTNMALADIAAHVGFANQSHLSSVFKEHTGRTPGAYRSHAHESLL